VSQTNTHCSIRRLPWRLCCVIIALICAGCARNLLNVNFFVVGEQTSLEKQVLGAYSSLGQDLLLYSSVRGVNTDGSLDLPPAATASQQATFAAMRNRQYNQDDIDMLLSAGIIGEANDGMLAWRVAHNNLDLPLSRAQVEQIVAEENDDRRVILNRLIATVPNLDQSQHDAVSQVYANLNQEAAPPGAWIQSIDGSWKQK
jgi:uncharacterized protein YdbL (DUF1318 family)